MPAHLQHEVSRLDRQLLSLGGLVEENFRIACKALIANDVELAKAVIEGDDEIDNLEVEVEEECLKILALHQPVAGDLRYIITCLKINNDLERIGDLSVNICRRIELLKTHGGLEHADKIEVMARRVQEMLSLSLDALVNQDGEKAREVLKLDEDVDTLNSEVYDFVKNALEAGSDNAVGLIHLLTVARKIERAGDHVTNVAEDVIYLLTGDIVRHQHATS